MKVALVLTCAVVVLQVADAGRLLRVPKVYNAVITTNEKILPSRAYPLAAPVIQPLAVPVVPPLPVIVSSPYLSVQPEEGSPSSEAPPSDATTTAPPADSNEGATEPPQDGSTKKPSSEILSGPAGQFLAPLAVPFSYYSPISYTAFSYYPSFVSYTYPLDYNAYGLPIPFVGQGLEVGKDSSADSNKNNEDKKDKVPDVPPPPPPNGAASDDSDSVAVEAE